MMITCAVVGFGWWGQHISRILKDLDETKIVCVVEPDIQKRSHVESLGLKYENDYADALSKYSIDAVILTSPNDKHDEQIALAANKGIHVYCEKPLSLTANGAQFSIATCKQNNVVLAIGHERRFEPGIQIIKEMITSSQLGTLMHGEFAFSHQKLASLPTTSWRTKKQYAPAGAMTQMGIHLTDLMIWFFGPVEAVHAITADRSLGWETGDLTSVHFQFESGATATLQAILNTPNYIRTFVSGTDAWVEVKNSSHPDTPGGIVSIQKLDKHGTKTEEELQWSDAVKANLLAFFQAILGNADYPFSEFELMHNIDVLEAIIKSSETKTSVKVHATKLE